MIRIEFTVLAARTHIYANEENTKLETLECNWTIEKPCSQIGLYAGSPCSCIFISIQLALAHGTSVAALAAQISYINAEGSFSYELTRLTTNDSLIRNPPHADEE